MRSFASLEGIAAAGTAGGGIMATLRQLDPTDHHGWRTDSADVYKTLSSETEDETHTQTTRGTGMVLCCKLLSAIPYVIRKMKLGESSLVLTPCVKKL